MMELDMVFRRSIMGVVMCVCLNAQVIDFESNGLHYKTLTRNGITVMFASLPVHIRDYDIMQVAIPNGSPISWTVKPEDFSVQKTLGGVFHAARRHRVAAACSRWRAVCRWAVPKKPEQAVLLGAGQPG